MGFLSVASVVGEVIRRSLDCNEIDTNTVCNHHETTRTAIYERSSSGM